jgi:egghead protein (zeste-white 4 protein)
VLPIKHVLNIASFISIFLLFLKLTGFLDPTTNDTHTSSTPSPPPPPPTYTYTFTLILTCLKLLGLSGLPISLCNLAGFLFYNISPPESNQPKRSPLLDPYFCIRIVTRGNYPELVRANVERNMTLCLDYGLDRFVIEVVSDRELALPKMPKLRELVVPEAYKTKRGTLFKARALQYALEVDKEFIGDEDWIVHLDEETALTRSSLTGTHSFFVKFRIKRRNIFFHIFIS